MEGSSVALIGAAGVIVGAIIGFLIARLSGDGQSKAELVAAREALDHYRAEVADHFKRSGALIAELTNSYRNVYQHMADGAQQLCSAEVARSVGETMQAERLENQAGSGEDSETLAEQNASSAAIAAAASAVTAAAAAGSADSHEAPATTDESPATEGTDGVRAAREQQTESQSTEEAAAVDAVGDSDSTRAHSGEAVEGTPTMESEHPQEDVNVAASDFEPQRRAG